MIDIDDCTPNPCENGGKCVDGVDDYECDCVAGFTGDDCEDGMNSLLYHVSLFLNLYFYL